MQRRESLRILVGSLLLGLVAVFSSGTAAQAGQNGSKSPSAPAYAKCAKACADCKTSCQACTKHCAAMIKAGMKGHEETHRLSADCADLCTAAAAICSRQGPMAAASCEACAQACDACGAACGKYPQMKEMQDCVRSCKACAAACRDMIKALK